MEDFKVYGFGDKLLIAGRIWYMLFFESDEPYRGAPFGYDGRIFKTKNGFHAIGHDLAEAQQKREWFEAWYQMYPASDYMMHNWNFLRPHTREEAKFILSRSTEVPKVCRYYRDKKVLEDWLAQ